MTNEELDKILLRYARWRDGGTDRRTVILFENDFEALVVAARDGVSPSDEWIDERIRKVIAEQVPGMRAMTLSEKDTKE
jgi:hypothetical protein